MPWGQILYQTFIKFSVFLYRWWNSLQSENNDSSALVYTESERKRDQKKKKKNYPFENGIGFYLTFRKWWYIVCLYWGTLYSGISVYWDKNKQYVYFLSCVHITDRLNEVGFFSLYRIKYNFLPRQHYPVFLAISLSGPPVWAFVLVR